MKLSSTIAGTLFGGFVVYTVLSGTLPYYIQMLLGRVPDNQKEPGIIDAVSGAAGVISDFLGVPGEVLENLNIQQYFDGGMNANQDAISLYNDVLKETQNDIASGAIKPGSPKLPALEQLGIKY